MLHWDAVPARHTVVVHDDNDEDPTRALVDVGRTAPAEGVGLRIPKELSREREMWD